MTINRNLTLGFALVAASALAAQESTLSAGFKLRGGTQVASRKDGLDNPIMGFGLELGLAVGGGRLVGELGYSFKPGTQYKADSDWFAGLPKAGAVTLDPTNSVDSRKNKIDGIYLRAGYEGPISADWFWRAGIQVGGSKFSHQAIGQVAVTTVGSTPNAYGVATTSGATTISPFGGVTFKLDDSSALEIGVLLLNYKAQSYTPIVGGSTGTLVENNRLMPHLEVAYAFRF